MDFNEKNLQNGSREVETSKCNLHEDIITKLNKCSSYFESAKILCQQVIEAMKTVESQLIQPYQEKAQTSIQGKVILDVGGVKYPTSIETLTREKGTFFSALLSKQWQLEKDPKDGSIFIDRDGLLFKHILSYLRTNIVSRDAMNDDALRELLVLEAEYFGLHRLKHILTDNYFPDGTLLLEEHKKILNTFYGKSNQRWELIYKATRDGFDTNVFHSRCNNKGPTMTIIRSQNNYLFGGYTSIPWTSDNSYKTDSTAFLFTLTNPHDIPPTKYPVGISTVSFAVRHRSDSGPTFGGGHDIYLANCSDRSNSSYIGFPMAYVDSTRMSNKTFTGALNFTAADIEVFRLA